MKENGKKNLKYMAMASLTTPIIMLVNWTLFEVDFTVSWKSVFVLANAFIHQIILYIIHIKIMGKNNETSNVE